jgi:hypothetical protein
MIVCLACVIWSCGAAAMAASRDASAKPEPVVVDQDVVDAALEKLQERQREREAAAPATQPSAPEEDPSDPYSVGAVTLRKLEVLRAYDARVTLARMALRQRAIDASDVRRLCAERTAFQGLSLDRCRSLMMEVDRQNADRLERYRDAFGDLPAAAKTVSVILMKSGQIDFATALPEDPLTREVEESRGVRRVYFQFYLNPPNGTPRRHNGYVEFVFDLESALWVPTWCDYKGETTPLFDAEAFVPLRRYEIVYDGKRFLVAQAPPAHPPEVFALLAPRWNAPAAMFGSGLRW